MVCTSIYVFGKGRATPQALFIPPPQVEKSLLSLGSGQELWPLPESSFHSQCNGKGHSGATSRVWCIYAFIPLLIQQ